MITNNLTSIPQIYPHIPLQANPSFLNFAVIGNGDIANLPKKKIEAKTITEACKQRIKELKARNKEIQPKKLREGRLALIGLASLISLVSGPLLGVIGIGLCTTGVFLPLGIGLIGVGAGMVFIGAPSLRFFNQKYKLKKEADKNKAHIKILQKLVKEPAFKNYVYTFRKELDITHLSVPTFAIKYNLIELYNLKNIYENDKLQKRQRKDYIAFFNFLREKIKITNQLLKEIEIQMIAIDKTISKTKDNEKIKKERRKEMLLKRAARLKEGRTNALKEAPHLMELSNSGISRLRNLQKMANLQPV